MYLTEELFESADDGRSYYSPLKQQAMDHQQHAADSLGKRKRNGDEYTTNTVPIKKIYSTTTTNNNNNIAAHHHPVVDYPPPPPPPHTHCLYPPSPPRRKQQQHHHRLIAQPRPSLHARAATYPRPTQPNRQQPRTTVPPPLPPTKTAAAATVDLTPCHSCHRAPKQKTDLDNYSSCAACGGRTCYICMRVCSGGGCAGRRKICRACCLEKGEEGETWCFACEEGGNAGVFDGVLEGGEEEVVVVGDQDVVMG